MSAASVLGVFGEVDAVVGALRQLQAEGYRDLSVYAPAPQHEIDEVLARRESPVRRFTLAGGLLGCAAGFGYAIATSLDWPLITGGKPINSWPPWVVIGFEVTVLFGALASVLGMLLAARLPSYRRREPYDPRFTEDKFGVLVPCDAHQSRAVQALLQRAGAEEVRIE